MLRRGQQVWWCPLLRVDWTAVGEAAGWSSLSRLTPLQPLVYTNLVRGSAHYYIAAVAATSRNNPHHNQSAAAPAGTMYLPSFAVTCIQTQRLLPLLKSCSNSWGWAGRSQVRISVCGVWSCVWSCVWVQWPAAAALLPACWRAPWRWY